MLLSGLQRVEYRGYDSAGLAVDDAAGKECVTITVRSVGNIQQLVECVDMAKKDGAIDASREVSQHVGVAHTRWATHGGVTKINCHPQQSSDGAFTVVHNGIITNFMELKNDLQNRGYEFASSTDTEVIAVLAQYLYSTMPDGVDFPTLMASVIRRMKGAYAILVKSTRFPDELFAYRSGSPLVIGARLKDDSGELPLADFSFDSVDEGVEQEYYFVSDCNSFLEYTPWALYCNDGDIVHFAQGKLQFFRDPISADKDYDDVQLLRIHPRFERLEGSISTLSKGEYPTFMLKEVSEQPESILSTMRHRIDFAANTVHLTEFSQEDIDRLLQSRRVFMISCGTSYHSCLAVRPLMEELVMPVSIENASDFLDRSPLLGPQDSCIFVSQSGETADVLLAMKHCIQHNAFLVGITNVKGSSIDRLANCSLQLGCGAEVGVASTKAYTAQVTLLIFIALTLSAGTSDERIAARRIAIIKGFASLSQSIVETLQMVTDPIKSIAKRLLHASSIMVLGRGYDFCTALEAALKIKELSYIHTEGVNSGELKHGALALVDEMLNVLCFCSKDKYYAKSMNAVYQIHARGGRPIIITNGPTDELIAHAREVIAVADCHVECLQPIVNAIPAQLLAYYLAVLRGNNVDCPRNLAKSVTVE